MRRVEAVRRATWRSTGSGFLTNILNPSLTAFYLIVLPQFIPRDEPFARSALILTTVHIAMAFSWHAAWAFAGGTLTRSLSGTRARQTLEIATSVALLGLAAKVAGAW